VQTSSDTYNNQWPFSKFTRIPFPLAKLEYCNGRDGLDEVSLCNSNPGTPLTESYVRISGRNLGQTEMLLHTTTMVDSPFDLDPGSDSDSSDCYDSEGSPGSSAVSDLSKDVAGHVLPIDIPPCSFLVMIVMDLPGYLHDAIPGRVTNYPAGGTEPGTH
jgi:hypothetical protein